MISVTKIFNFCYAHYLEDYEGKCSEMHGHNCRLEVEISNGWNLSKTSGMTIDFNELKKVVQREVIEKLDHKCLNHIPDFKRENPTAENMCLWIVDRLEPIYEEMLVKVVVWETEASYATWKRKN